MSMSGSRLQGNLKDDFFTNIKNAFPLDPNLKAAEKTAILNAQEVLSQALANAAGPDVVTEVQQATVNVNGTASVTSAPGTAPVTGTGTVS